MEHIMHAEKNEVSFKFWSFSKFHVCFVHANYPHDALQALVGNWI